MTAMAFDTYEAANRFKAAGFTESQVDALVEVTRMTTALPDISTLATKDDLLPLKSDILAMSADISSLRTDLNRVESVLRTEIKAEISGVKTLIATSQVQTIALVLTGTAAMLTLFKLFH